MVTDYMNLPFIEKVKNNVPEFGNKVIEIANDLGWSAKWLMVVMNNESGLNEKAKNPTSSATGLIQFMKDTAIQLGTSTDALSKMSNVKQLDYVHKYLKPYANHVKNVSDAYLTVFFPLALFKADSWQFPAWVVKANPIFFKKGNTKKDFSDYTNNKYFRYV